MHNHCFQAIGPDRYFETRGASNPVFNNIVAYIVADIDFASKSKFSILVLGSNNGNNDLLPLVSELEKVNNNCIFDITAVDDSISSISISKLPQNILFTFVNEDIEDYSSSLYIRKYDIIISFFVLHHLTNWEYSFFKLSECLYDKASIFILEYDDIEIQAFEGKFPEHKKGVGGFNYLLFEGFHNGKLRKFGTFYESFILGSNSDFLQSFIGQTFSINAKYFFYQREIDFSKINQKFKTTATHAPLFWGQFRNYPNNTCNKSYEDFIDSLPYSTDIVLKTDSAIKLLEFKKRDSFKIKDYHFNLNFGKFFEILNSKLDSSNKSTFNERIFLQTLLTAQCIVRDTKIVTPLFWRPMITKGELSKDFTNGSFESLISTRNFYTNLVYYRLHVTLFESTPFSEIIFSNTFWGYNWLWQKGDNFKIELQSVSDLKFIVVTLPFYEDFNQGLTELIKLKSFDFYSFNNYSLLDLSNITFNSDIDFDSLQLPSIQNSSSIIDSFLSQNNFCLSYELIQLFKSSIHQFSLLLNIGNCCYLTNEVSSLDNSKYSNGGIFLCEKDLSISKMRNDDFTFYRVKLLHEAISVFSRKIVLPYLLNDLKLNFKIIQQQTIKAAFSKIINRNYAHHIGSHVSHRSTLDKIIERVTGETELGNTDHLHSLIEMENRLTRYKDERNDFIAGIDNNSHPVTMFFYKDIIQPFIENSLILDNIAKSEGVSWNDDPISYGKVKEDGISKLRIRVFYHNNITTKKGKLNICYPKEISHKSCSELCSHSAPDGTLTLKELGLGSNWSEMVAHYSNVNKTGKNICIHQLPYFKKCIKDNERNFYDKIDYTIEDIEIALPGALGSHSVYSILENHIRNVAKHAQRNTLTKANHLDIIIKVSRKIDTEGEDYDYFNFELTSNIPTIKVKDAKNKLNEIRENKLKEAISSETTFLGFADMRINAALLAFDEITQSTLDSSMQAGTYPEISSETNEEEYIFSLKYNFKLTKPCKIVFIGSDFNDFNSNDFINNGYRQYNTAQEAIASMTNKPRSFQFAVVENTVFSELTGESGVNNDSFNNYFNLFVKNISWRVLVTGDFSHFSDLLRHQIKTRRVTCAKGLNFKNLAMDKWLDACWDKWLDKRWEGPYKLCLRIDENGVGTATGRYDDKKIDDVWIYKNAKTDIDYQEKFFYTIYDRHGTSCYGGILDEKEKPALKTKQIANEKLNFSWVFLDKNNPDFDRIFLDNLTNPKISFSKLIESGLHNILVIDERAREASLENTRHSFHVGKDFGSELFQTEAISARVFIADSLIIDNKEELYESNQNASQSKYNLQIILSDEELLFAGHFSKYIKLDKKNSNFDTLIIHRTMLNKIVKEDKELNMKFLLLSDLFPNIIVTTGSGTINYLPWVMNRIRIIPFFTIRKYILNGNIAKNCLTDII